ncbi:peptidylprolyl isomerase fpr3 [Coemansia sp. BCRC 34301]|nr:peptidylprolyl isomerase fpr3 [Coemansia sp. BCRC 34301]
MFRGFWGLKIVPGKTYTQTVDAAFRVSNASLGIEIAEESRTSVMLTVDQKSFILCSLTPGKVEQQLLDISLTEGEEITFETHGKNEVHLTGNFIADDEDDEEGMYGSSDEEDEEQDGEDIDFSNISPEELQDLINRGMIDPSDLAIGSDESDEDYDSDDAETDGRIREVTDEEEDELVEEAMSEEEEEKPIVEVKIKKQAEKKRKPAAEDDAKPAVAASAADAKPPKKAKQAEKAAAAKQEKADKPKQEKADKPKQEKAKTLPGGVIVETKTEGAGAPAKKGQRVGMYYIGKLTNGKVFDQNTKGKPFWFRLGAGEVIKGWDTGIIGMKKGEERRLTIPGPMAYGSRGAPPDIPPHATLVFDIRLVEFK